MNTLLKLSISSFVYFLAIISQPVLSSERVFKDVLFVGGADNYQSAAIAHGLSNIIRDNLVFYLRESHFHFGKPCSQNESNCRQNLEFNVGFKTTSLDLNTDGVDEVLVYYQGPASCGSGGCNTYILSGEGRNWAIIGQFFSGPNASILEKKTKGYMSVKYGSGEQVHICDFNGVGYDC
jgi:hypothetical protein